MLTKIFLFPSEQKELDAKIEMLSVYLDDWL